MTELEDFWEVHSKYSSIENSPLPAQVIDEHINHKSIDVHIHENDKYGSVHRHFFSPPYLRHSTSNTPHTLEKHSTTTSLYKSCFPKTSAQLGQLLNGHSSKTTLSLRGWERWKEKGLPQLIRRRRANVVYWNVCTDCCSCVGAPSQVHSHSLWENIENFLTSTDRQVRIHTIR